MRSNKLTYLPLLSLGLFFIATAVMLLFTTPEKIVDVIGVHNGYALLFVVTFIAGVSTFTSIPYQVLLVTLAAGGLNPLLLGLVATVGDMLGDSTSYYLGYFGRALLPEGGKWVQDKVHQIQRAHPRLLPLVFFLYGSVSPFSNDVITIPFGMARYPFFSVMGPLALGNLVYNTTLAFFGEAILKVLATLFS